MCVYWVILLLSLFFFPFFVFFSCLYGFSHTCCLLWLLAFLVQLSLLLLSFALALFMACFSFFFSLVCQPGGRARFLPRSRSHDDPCADPVTASAGSTAEPAPVTAEPAPVVKPSEHHRSPSLSPPISPSSSSKLEAPPHSFEAPPLSLAAPPQPSSHVYVVRCDSSDSLSATESSALLRDEEKSNSLSSLCLYYADEDIPDGGKVWHQEHSVLSMLREVLWLWTAERIKGSIFYDLQVKKHVERSERNELLTAHVICWRNHWEFTLIVQWKFKPGSKKIGGPWPGGPVHGNIDRGGDGNIVLKRGVVFY